MELTECVTAQHGATCFDVIDDARLDLASPNKDRYDPEARASVLRGEKMCEFCRKEAANLQLGPCCVCETTVNVRNILSLHTKAPIPGHGWGCVQCGLDADGALAVVCDACLELPLKFACRGYPGKEGRIPIEDLTGEMEHDYVQHPESWWFDDSPDAGDPECICSICRREIPHAENLMRMFQREDEVTLEARFHQHCFEEVRHYFQ